ncbi:CmpA/NrtA family ABC transporter substrate-binding protein [Dankookia sp. GCM10030260]|uniref:CmpA/NrtA family ABC transporter substrate-binding protein n=1 Tax=Dankookia sp. GCM10030260 TaxID=3273390 RepID=UPI00361478DD
MPSETVDPEIPAAPRSQRRTAARTLRLGCVQLTDAAPLLVAEELGLFDAVGLRVTLSIETAWAALRDKLAFGALDAAQLLGPMPIALAAGLDGVRAQLTVAAGLGANGNTLTISRALAQELGRFPRPLPAAAFAAVARRRADAGKPVTFGVVFAYSSHNYLLRWWLASAGLDPDRDLRLVVVPPALCAQRLADGAIDGFCAGEPWGSHAAERGAGTIALSSGDIWPNHPEKVLAFAAGYALRDPESATACTAAVIAATRWLDEPENKAEAVHILQRRAFPELSAAAIGAAFDGTAEGFMQAAPLRFRTATLPRREQAAWWLRQMRRWGHVPANVAEATALAPWRQDIWRAAAARLREVEPPAPSPPPADMPETHR